MARLAENNYNDAAPYCQGYAEDSFLAIRGEINVDWSIKIKSSALIAYFDTTNSGQGPLGVKIDLSTQYKYSDNLNFTAYISTFLPGNGAVDSSGDTSRISGNKDLIFAFIFETTITFKFILYEFKKMILLHKLDSTLVRPI